MKPAPAKSPTTETWQPAETAPKGDEDWCPAFLGAFNWREDNTPAGVHSVRWQPHWKAWVCSSVMIKLDTDVYLVAWKPMPKHPEDVSDAE